MDPEYFFFFGNPKPQPAQVHRGQAGGWRRAGDCFFPFLYVVVSMEKCKTCAKLVCADFFFLMYCNGMKCRLMMMWWSMYDDVTYATAVSWCIAMGWNVTYSCCMLCHLWWCDEVCMMMWHMQQLYVMSPTAAVCYVNSCCMLCHLQLLARALESS